MQAALVLLAVAGSTAWLAVDASKRDWTGNGFAKNVPSWVIGSLLIWPLVFPMYVFAHRKKAPLKDAAPPEPKPELAATRPQPKLEPVVAIEREPVVAPVLERERDGVATHQPDPSPLVEISHPAPIADDAPPGLDVDAFQDIKPVSFAGAHDAPAPPAELNVEVAPQPEPVVEIEPEPEPVTDAPRTDEPVAVEPDAVEPPPAAPAPKRRGLKLPNPKLKLPRLGRKPKPAVAAAAQASAKPARKSFLTLPPSLQGPLTEIERKIVIGSAVAVVLAAALGYSSAPADDAAAPPPPPAPAAAAR
jgi:hypothetical protein